ncbi:hypothetical protein D6P96_22255 [Salmonella enterica subsp. enterica serovar Eingedi]|nr:hypothetical protein [Salmonella enterica subsp. enterica serovar Eingedi]
MLTIAKIQDEATMFRKLIEICDKKNTSLIVDSFPIMSCKLSSMLLSYHFLMLWPELEIKGVSAATGKNDQITHYWLEINDIVVDITGDQYNLINDCELTNKIIKSRPFPSMHVSHNNESYLYNIFKIKETYSFVHGFPEIADDFIDEMAHGYSQLLNP